MKKAIALLLAGLTISVMIGCNKPAEGDNQNAPATTAGTPSSTPATGGNGTSNSAAPATNATAGTPATPTGK